MRAVRGPLQGPEACERSASPSGSFQQALIGDQILPDGFAIAPSRKPPLDPLG